jgi:DivIVA domain-containing protein
MKIEASTVEAHRFVRVRRKGYDPIEVDRVMDRLVTTLRAHEQDTAELEERVAVADDSVDAIRRTFAAAQRTRDEMINESAARAATIIEDADGEAGRITESARTEAEAVMFERDEAIIQAHREGADRMAEAEAASHRLLLGAEMARSDAVTLTEQALEHNAARIEAMKTAAAVEAERHANEIVGAARREEIRLATRLGELRTAVADVEAKINDLAALTTTHTTHIADVIDLTVIDGEALGIGLGRS